MYTIDLETIGFHGFGVILQYAKDDGEVKIHRIWQEPIRDTLELISEIYFGDVQFFNAAFDHFHISKIYTTFSLFPDFDAIPDQHVNEIGMLEERARFLDLVIKPKRARDVMLLARRGPYQSLMNRDDIRIKRIPRVLGKMLAEELEKRIKFDDILFARQKSQFDPRWKIYDIKDAEGNVNLDFVDIKLKFKASGALKSLAKHVLKISDDELLTYGDVDSKLPLADELGWAPYALAVTPGGPETFWTGKDKDGKAIRSWPALVDTYVTHWGYNANAIRYAKADVDYTRRLGKIISPEIEPGDDDSELACMVGSVRWRGFAVNEKRLREEKTAAQVKLKEGIIPRDHRKVMIYLKEVMDETERIGFTSTKKNVLEIIGQGKEGWDGHPAQIRAKDVLDSRKAKKRIELIDKLLHARRLHAGFKVIGALSNRMSGAGGVNTQGIDHTDEMRSCFQLADIEDWDNDGKRDFILCGGDFKSFEVSLAAKVFNDKELDKALMSGVKIHAQLGAELFPGETYQSVLASAGKDPDMYDKGKKGVFLMFYGGDENTFYNKLGIPIEIGKKALDRFLNRYQGIRRFGEWVNSRFGALRQPGGIGSRVEWVEPQEYAESFLGFRRYFTLEYKIARALFELAQKPPEVWKVLRIPVKRRDRIQTASGACQSALYGAAFVIISAIVRAAKNHYIQSPGASITKSVQRRVWDFQPLGIGPWIVQPMNVHDEILAPTRRGFEQTIEKVVLAKVEEFKAVVPLLAIDWISNISNWAAKKG